MMDAYVTYRGRTYKTVRVLGATASTTDDALLTEALAVAGESRSSIFGHKIDRVPDLAVVVVTLHTD